MVWSSEVCNLPAPQHHYPDMFLRVRNDTKASWAHGGKKHTRAQFDSLDGVP